MRDDCLDPSKNPRAKHFARKRRVAQAFRDADMESIAATLENCQEISVQAFCRNCMHIFYVPEKCRSRVCPLCSFARSRDRGRMILALTARMKFPKLLTLTMPRWTGIPSDGIDRLREAWNLFRKQPVFETVSGGVYQIELKPKNDGWHIHLHAVLDCPFIPYQHVFSAWTKILGIQFAEIDIRAAKTDAQRVYVAKYAAKSADFEGDLPDVVAWYNATKGKRLFAGFGVWYNISPEDLPAETDWHPEPFACPSCGEIATCGLSRHAIFTLGPDILKEIKGFFDAAGPPEKDLW